MFCGKCGDLLLPNGTCALCDGADEEEESEEQA